MEEEAQLSSVERRALVEDIGRIGAAIGSDMARADAPLPVSSTTSLTSAETATPFERIRLLEALWPQIATALRALLRAPDTTTERCSTLAPPAQSRGGVSAANAVARRPRARGLWQSAQRPSNGSSDQHASPPSSFRLPDVRLRATEDTPANRLIAALLREIEREAAALRALADFCGEETEMTRAACVMEAARRWSLVPFFHNLPPPAASERAALLQGALALRCPPPYRALLRDCHRLVAPLRFDWAGSPMLSLPALPGWHLYEIWCFLRVAQQLREEGWRAVAGDAVRWEGDGLRLTLARGRASRLRFARRGEQIALMYQPLFLSANQAARFGDGASETNSSSDFYSRSHAMQPDMALVYRGRLFLLDPKFRSYAVPGEEQDDVNKMHAYRDAIARRSSASAQEAVAAAWCLFPGVPLASSLSETIRAYPEATPTQPFGTAGVGAVRLRPASAAANSPLASLLRLWLS